MKYVELSEDGVWHPTKDAFRGGKPRRISVDRAEKCNNDPSHTQKGRDPVCGLKVEKVRSIDVGDRMNSKGAVIDTYVVCVDATPKPCNAAHADVYARPESAPERAGDRAYKLLREGLAALAEWEEGFAPSGWEGV